MLRCTACSGSSALSRRKGSPSLDHTARRTDLRCLGNSPTWNHRSVACMAQPSPRRPGTGCSRGHSAVHSFRLYKPPTIAPAAPYRCRQVQTALLKTFYASIGASSIAPVGFGIAEISASTNSRTVDLLPSIHNVQAPPGAYLVRSARTKRCGLKFSSVS
jgi:hypothetical protein